MDDILDGKLETTFIADVVGREMCVVDESDIEKPTQAVVKRIFNAVTTLLLNGR